MAGNAYQFTGAGIRGIGCPDPTLDDEPEVAASPAARPKAVAAKSPDLSPKNIITLAKRRQRDINRELKKLRAELKRLEREKIQIDGLVGAASKPLAIVHQLKSGTK